MLMGHDENADHNVEINRERKIEIPTKAPEVPSTRPLEPKNIRVSEGDSSSLKFGPTFKEWATRKREALQAPRKEGAPRFEAASPKYAAGRPRGTPKGEKRHFSSKDLLAQRDDGYGSDTSCGTSKSEKRHFSSKDLLLQRDDAHGSETPCGTPKGEKRHFSSKDLFVQRDDSHGLDSIVDARWSHSLREGVGSHQWTSQITVPNGPTFRTPNRSRSASRRSCTPECTTPAASCTPRGRTMPWELSLREGAPPPATLSRAASVDSTPKRQKRRSLSHWWAESSAPPKVSCRGDDDTVSDSSVGDPHYTDPVTLLNNMPQHAKRLSVERKRHRLAALARENSTEKSASFDPNGSQNWLRSLRQGGSCPPSMHRTKATLTTGHEPSMRTVERARIRAASHSTERFAMGEYEHLHPRERSALEKYLQRARSCSRGNSVNGTPQKSASRISSRCQTPRSRSQTPGSRCQTPREQGAARNLEHGVRGRSDHRSASATPEQTSSAGGSFNSRQRAALQRHLERVAARSCSAHRSASATPERQASNHKPRPARERAAVPQFKCQLQNHLEKHMARHLRRVAETAAAATARDAAGEEVSASAEASESKQKAEQHPVDKEAEKAITASKVLVEKSKSTVDKEWVREAANPEERAERARTATQTKLEQALVHQRNKVCVFKRRAAAAPQ